MDVSYDGGLTFGKDREIATLHEGWTLDIPGIYRSNGMPFIACNQLTGSIYITYADREPGEHARVHLLRTNAKMETWNHYYPSDPKKGDAFFPNLVINPKTGKVGVVFYQAVRKKRLRVELYTLTTTQDGSNQVLSKKFKKPGDKVFFGDYIDIDYIGNGFIAAWTSYEKRQLLVRVGKVKDS